MPVALSAESAYLSIVAGRYTGGKKEPNLDTVLNGHAGNEIKVSRRGRRTERTERACLTLCLMVQQHVIESLGQVDGFRDRGAAARLLPALPADLIGTRKTSTTPVPSAITASWHATVRRILDTPRTDIPRVLKLDTEALAKYDAYRGELEPTLKSEGRDMQGWLAKLAGAILCIAGLLHIAEHEHPEDIPVSGDTIDRAISIGAYFRGHTRIMFRLMYGRNGQSEAGEILDVLRTLEVTSITKRDLHQRVRYRAAFQNVESLNSALDTLEEYGWIRREKPINPKGGRPSEAVLLNPELGVQNAQNPITAFAERDYEELWGAGPEIVSLHDVVPVGLELPAPTSTDAPWSMDV